MSLIDFSSIPEMPFKKLFSSFNGDTKNNGGDKRLVVYEQRTKY